MNQLFVVFFVFQLTSTNINIVQGTQSNTFVDTTTKPQFIPYRYERYIFFYFSQSMTGEFFVKILKKLFEFDNYCGGENYRTSLILTNVSTSDYYDTSDYYTCKLCSLEEFLGPIIDFDAQYFLEFFTTYNASSGTIDYEDVYNLSARLTKAANQIGYLNFNYRTVSQVILVTDYVTASINSTNTTDVLLFLKSNHSITFIALTSNISDDNIKNYFSDDIWAVFPNYTIWTPESATINPICNYNSSEYMFFTTVFATEGLLLSLNRSVVKRFLQFDREFCDCNMLFGSISATPIPAFSGNSTLSIYLFLSARYANSSSIMDVSELFLQLTKRRWQYPCQQYRAVLFTINVPVIITFSQDRTCFVDDSLERNSRETPQGHTVCDEFFFNNSVITNINYWYDGSQDNITCNDMYTPFFFSFLRERAKERNKYLLITDLPLMCPDYTTAFFTALKNFDNYGSGAPLTVIAIDKEDEKMVANSYKVLFPPTQTPNLYEVNTITELFPKMNKTINFCLNSVPWLQSEKVRVEGTYWYFYLIGASLLIGLINTVVIFVVWRNGKRKAKLRQIREQINMTASNLYQNPEYLEISDVWEVSLKSLNFDNKTFLGKGAFSFVYSVYLHGKAPVRNIFPSIALQQFSDCDVALKTLPQHCTENDKTRFRDEIRLMKEIGYHVHLVSMLGCNSSIERPFLLMELAQQDLYHWLRSCETSGKEEIEATLDKTLLSVAWQVSDGMSYLSAKNFVHRDLAARNVLLNSDMKAMISDFGLCQKLNDGEQFRTISGGKLPIKWIALESLQEQQFSSKTDVWSFGVLLFEIFSLGLEPYGNFSGEELIAFLREGNRLAMPRFANEEIYDLMKHCWQVDPDRRPDFFKIESHFARVLEESAANYGYLQTIESKISEG